jgi:predicted DNA-binding transcriptional regulator AlpA
MTYRDLFHKTDLALFKNTSKLREFVDKAASSNTESEMEHNLGMFAHYYVSYRYKSIPIQESAFYDKLFTIINTETAILHDWMTAKQVIEEFGFSKSWLEKRRMATDTMNFPFYKPAGFIKYKRSEINAWIEEHKIR